MITSITKPNFWRRRSPRRWALRCSDWFGVGADASDPSREYHLTADNADGADKGRRRSKYPRYARYPRSKDWNLASRSMHSYIIFFGRTSEVSHAGVAHQPHFRMTRPGGAQKPRPKSQAQPPRGQSKRGQADRCSPRHSQPPRRHSERRSA